VRLTATSISLLAVALSVTVLFAMLGMWQLDRAAQKRATFAEFEQRGRAAQVDLNQPGVADSVALNGYRAVAAGHYPGATILFDNQMHRGRAGYLVYSVFKLDGRHESVLVNRGWLKAAADRSVVPELAAPAAGKQLEGRLNLPPHVGLRFEGGDMIEHLAADLWRVQSIDFTDLTTTVGVDLLPITVMLNSDTPDHFVRSWTSPGSDETRHLGYAFQWFALAVTVVVVTVALTLRSRNQGMS